MSLFSKNLRFLRRQRELKQDKIAGLFNKRANTVGNWENEKSEPNLSELVKLGEYFNISVHELLHTDLEKESQPAESTIAGSGRKRPSEYIVKEPFSNVAHDEGEYTLSSLHREMRTVHEKLDKITSLLNAAGVISSIDKSNH